MKTSFIPDSMQAAAIEACIDTSNLPAKRIVAVTGEAGTGKTRIMQLVHDALTDAGYRVALCAPTGKAARRIRESTDRVAHTIHMLLEYTKPGEPDPKTGKVTGISVPQRYRGNPVQYDYVLADEYAMVNDELHRNIIDALPTGGKLRVFGDINQLPPIEENKRLQNEPSPFKQLLNKFTGVTLNVNHRQDEGSGIAAAGRNILLGRIPKRADDFVLEFSERPVDKLGQLVMQAMESNADYSSLDCQVITTMFKTWVGTYKLNGYLQTLFNRGTGDWFQLPRHPWAADAPVRVRVGDKVINTRNLYDLDCFNGETGIIREITEYEELIIDFGDRVITFPPVLVCSTDNGVKELDPRRCLDLAYALTTHKCQGSEYNEVAYILNKSTSYMQCRSNLYTAVTRGRNKTTVITDQVSLSRSIQRKELMR